MGMELLLPNSSLAVTTSDHLPASVSLLKLSKRYYGTCMRSQLEKLGWKLQAGARHRARCQDKASCWTRAGGKNWGHRDPGDPADEEKYTAAFREDRRGSLPEETRRGLNFITELREI